MHIRRSESHEQKAEPRQCRPRQFHPGYGADRCAGGSDRRHHRLCLVVLRLHQG